MGGKDDKFQAGTSKNKSQEHKPSMVQYVIEIINKLKAKVDLIINTINNNILDLANDYSSLIYVLTILGDFNHHLALAIRNFYELSPQS